MSLRKLSPALQLIANNELNEDSTRIQEDLEHIRNWLQKQPHLTPRLDDQFLTTFLRGCKWSLQKTKDKMDNYYTIPNFLPEMFSNRDPLLPEIQCLLEVGLFFPLPNINDPDGPRILLFNLSSVPTENVYNNEAAAKLFFMTLDILLNEDDNFNVAGFHIIGNYENVPLSVFLQYPPTLVKKYVTCMTKAYPLRGKLFVGLNAPVVFETLINTLVKPLLNKKAQKRFYIFNSANIAKSYEIFDKSLFPKEFGGQNGSIKEIGKQWKSKVESYRDWFLEGKYGCNEKLRIGASKTYDDNFGMDGSFKKLNID